MTFLLIRSIPISIQTKSAWKNAGVDVVPRSVTNLNDRYDNISAIINMGNLEIDLSEINTLIFNKHDTIRAISTPKALRNVFGECDPPIIPIATYDGPHWHKGKGCGGANKMFHEDTCKDEHIIASDLQQHIKGTEYRVLTVGDIIVQATQKNRINGIGNFDWNWIGVHGIRNSGIISHIKQAITLIPAWTFSILGWDIIYDNSNNNIYTIEINTAPGVNKHSAQRIVNQIRKTI